MVRVLTVDDQPHFRAAARALVGVTPGFEVVAESGSGESALPLAQEVHPDVILLDARMPGMDGLETARRLSAEDPTQVIVLVSSADLQPLAGEAGASGVAAVLRKHWLTPRLLRGLWIAHRRRDGPRVVRPRPLPRRARRAGAPRLPRPARSGSRDRRRT